MNMEVMINGIRYVPEETRPALTLADVMEHYEGTKEYDGIVATVQKWYYGSLVKAPWCATFLCWCLAQMGLRDYTLGGKTDNVFTLYHMLEKSVKAGTCEKVQLVSMRRGDIVIFKWENDFHETSSKHVGVIAYDDTHAAYTIGGNQDNCICTKPYAYSNIVGIYRPHYGNSSLKSVRDLPNG